MLLSDSTKKRDIWAKDGYLFVQILAIRLATI